MIYIVIGRLKSHLVSETKLTRTSNCITNLRYIWFIKGKAWYEFLLLNGFLLLMIICDPTA